MDNWNNVDMILPFLIFLLLHFLLLFALKPDGGAGKGPAGLGERCIGRCSCSSEDRLATTGSPGCFPARKDHW